ncbi:MAG: glycosyltransferase, partial [Thermoleophilia bacterium]|nr:glycosyltransferase [Thermoleophilia bacterium]
VETWVPSRLRGLTREIHRRAEAAVCVSPAVAESVLRNGIDAERVHVVRNGVDLERLRERAAEPSPLPDARAPRVVAVGRLSQEKAFDLLLEAHAAARTGVPHELVILGEGPLLTSLRALADALGTRDSVLLPGYVPNPFPVVAGAAAFVLSSRTEGATLSLIEALALGVPVIATRCGSGVEEVLGHGDFGLLVEPGSPRALTEALERHLRDPAGLRARAAAASGHVARYDARETARAFAGILAATAAGRAKGAGGASAARGVKA